ncbi:MAG: tetratricopeptide repeat protein [Gammaproteobacteria bacterium]|nr:tetratricopeptide repeat protein [Gammaproteobacteria bacterium]
MKNYRQLLVVAMTIVVSACATQGHSGRDAAEISAAGLPENIPPPGTFKTGVDQADLMYEAMLAEIAAQRGQLQIALDYYHHVAMQTQDVYYAERAARVGNYVRAYQKALDAALIWRAKDKENAEANQLVSVLYLRTGRYNLAAAELEKILKETDKERLGQAFLQLGALFQREVPLQQAMELMDTLLEKYSKVPEALYVAASLHLGLDQKEQALERVNQVVKISPDWEEGALLRLRVLFTLHRKEEAITLTRKYLEQHRDKQSVRLAYARALVENNQYADARSQYELLLVKLPESEEVLYSLAMLSLQFKDYNEAEGYLQQLEKTGKREDQVKYYLGQIAEQRGDDEKAMDWYSSVGEGEFYLDAQLRLGMVLAKAKSLEEAIEHLHGIPVSNADEKRMRILFEGDLLRRYSEFKQASRVYEVGLKEFPDDIDLLYGHALVDERMGRVNDSIATMRKILVRQPDNVAALNALGYTLIDRTKDLVEGRELLEKAYAKEPNDPAIIDSMGWLYYRLGDYNKSLEMLAKANSMVEDAEVMAHYGEVLWVAGQQDKAREVWNKAQEQFPENLILRATVKRFIKK